MTTEVSRRLSQLSWVGPVDLDGWNGRCRGPGGCAAEQCRAHA
jgi:hypothetical protein